MKISFRKSIVIHPILFAVFPVLSIFSQNIQEVNPADIVMSLIIILIFTVIIWLFLSLILKDYRKSGIIVSIGLVLFFSYGHIFNIIQGLTLWDFEIVRHRFIMIPFLALFIAGIYFVTKSKKFDKVTTVANAIAASLIIISFSTVVAYTFENPGLLSIDIENEKTISILSTNNPPNIYYIILDEYASLDTLRDVYNYDNSDFLSSLEERGFFVAYDSHTNYALTFLSITSSLNMEYLNHLSDKIGTDSRDRKLPNELFTNNKVMKILKSNGYNIVNLSLNFIKLSDHDLCLNLFFTKEFEVILWESTIAKPLLITIMGIDQAHRDLILCKFSQLTKLNQTIEQPFFVYAHFILPHPPYVFGEDGEPVTPKSLSLDADVWDDKPSYVNQVKFSNKKILETIDLILTESDIPPIIIIQSDHGTPTLLGGSGLNWNNVSEDSIKERMSILNAYYFPENANMLLYETITPINSFRLIFNNYYNGTFDLLEDKMYYSNYKNPYNFTDVTNLLIKK